MPRSKPQNTVEALSEINRLTDTQREVLGNIAFGADAGQPRKIAAALERSGLIFSYQEEKHFRDGLPSMTITRYGMDIFVHIAFCEWCSLNVKPEARDDLS